jgi:uncharacterized protein
VSNPVATDDVKSATGFHVMTKPIGPICNLDCSYCFYLEKERLFPKNERFQMSDEVLETYVRDYLAAQPGSEVTFAWQGGEPTLLGVDFFRRAVALQREHADGRAVTNTIQTNATLLDDEWAAFLAEHDFLVGVSIDGPRELHDTYRVDKRGGPTFDKVMRGIELLRKHGVRFNTLTVVNRRNSRHPLEVYHFLKEIGSGFIQFIPLVERRAGGGTFDFAPPPQDGASDSPVTEWSVDPDDFGGFLVAIFDEWVRHDVGKTFVGLFDEALAKWAGLEGSMCVFSETCGRAMAMEHNGDLYSCDHYVYPEYKLGNILEQSIKELAGSQRQQRFGSDKRDKLPAYCRRCEVRFACHGECPKHRFMTTPDGEPGLNYLCVGYKRFFTHVDRPMQVMARLWKEQRSPARIMDLMAGRDAFLTARPNDPCPCGSGKKFKKCCAKAALPTDYQPTAL